MRTATKTSSQRRKISSLQLWMMAMCLISKARAFTTITTASRSASSSNLEQQHHLLHLSSSSMTSIDDATFLLQKWDTAYNKEEGSADKIEALLQEQKASLHQLADAVKLLSQQAAIERQADPTVGRCMLGICASSVQEGIATLKAWVAALQLPRGLLHGMDKDGIPLDIQGAVYIKYNSGGVYTFTDIRKSGMGFDALWKPGDALLEEYDGSYRGVYFQVELTDQQFRQFLVPLALFEPEQTSSDNAKAGQE